MGSNGEYQRINFDGSIEDDVRIKDKDEQWYHNVELSMNLSKNVIMNTFLKLWVGPAKGICLSVSLFMEKIKMPNIKWLFVENTWKSTGKH